MTQQRILKLVEMPNHTPENPSLNEAHIAKHNLIAAKGLSPTDEELKVEETRLLEEYASLQYQRDRRYPRVGEQLDLLHHDMTSGKADKTGEWYKTVKKVKDDNPKSQICQTLVGPEGQFAFTDGVLSYHDNPDISDHITLRVTEEQITTEMARIQAEYDSQEYARNRKIEYDALNQFELISDDDVNGTTTHKDAIAAIKAKYPKP